MAKIQHYVPQFLLRNFGNGKKDQVWVYDKITSRSFLTNAKNIASESRFYDFQFEGQSMSLEPILSKIESNAKPIINKIIKADSLTAVNDEDKATLAVFFSVQFTRTKAFRAQWRDFPRMLREHFTSRGEAVEHGSQAAELIRDITENESKLETARFLMHAPRDFAPHFINKHWVLAATTGNHPFLIGDNPLTLQNMNDMSPRGNLGLAVPGIEIYFPLSPLRALAMWCPSIIEMVRQGAEINRNRLPLKINEDVMLLEEAITTGCALAYKKENVENFNSLQIAHSERYVFSRVDDFRLATDMLRSNPKLKRGPRAEIA